MFFKWFSKNRIWGIFVCVKLYCFPKVYFTTFLHMCKPRVVRFNFYLYLLCLECFSPFILKCVSPLILGQTKLSVEG